MKTTVVIPWRDRGIDLRRSANLQIVMAWWWAHGFTPILQSDGLEGTTQFNRHRAYNLAVSGNPDTDMFVFTEADMLIHPKQIASAVSQAYDKTGLVVPFKEYRYLSDATTTHVRDTFYDLSDEDLAMWWTLPPNDPSSVFDMRPESVMKSGKSIGAVNVVSRETLDQTGGFTEATSGNWYDDNIIEEGFAFLTNRRTRWVNGPAIHLYHLPGWTGDHLTDEDRQATAHNKKLLSDMRRHIHFGYGGKVRALMRYRQGRTDLLR